MMGKDSGLILLKVLGNQRQPLLIAGHGKLRKSLFELAGVKQIVMGIAGQQLLQLGHGFGDQAG